MRAKTKLVNGIRVDLSREEAAQIEAEWAAEAAKPGPPTPRNMEQEIDALKARITKLEVKQKR
ncbi:hypothetical protein LCGC14_0557450 [marine sediment metagenome]|uniref:Uncharacterized protein n=1 Tax=marine sediment metagenome TaxID=412755 RepID=A0A0F9RT58_9ZZZZ